METLHYVQVSLDEDVWNDSYWNGQNFEDVDDENPATVYHNKGTAMRHIKKDAAWMKKNCEEGVEITRYRIKTITTYDAKSATEILKET